MGVRIKKWRMRREKEGGVRLARVGGALELVNNERVECESFSSHRVMLISAVDALDNEEINIDFRPLYQCIHIYEALDAKPELQRSYQEDRKASSHPLLISKLIGDRHKQISSSHPAYPQPQKPFFTPYPSSCKN